MFSEIAGKKGIWEGEIQRQGFRQLWKNIEERDRRYDTPNTS